MDHDLHLQRLESLVEGLEFPRFVLSFFGIPCSANSLASALKQLKPLAVGSGVQKRIFLGKSYGEPPLTIVLMYFGPSVDWQPFDHATKCRCKKTRNSGGSPDVLECKKIQSGVLCC